MERKKLETRKREEKDQKEEVIGGKKKEEEEAKKETKGNEELISGKVQNHEEALLKKVIGQVDNKDASMSDSEKGIPRKEEQASKNYRIHLMC